MADDRREEFHRLFPDALGLPGDLIGGSTFEPVDQPLGCVGDGAVFGSETGDLVGEAGRLVAHLGEDALVVVGGGHVLVQGGVQGGQPLTLAIQPTRIGGGSRQRCFHRSGGSEQSFPSLSHLAEIVHRHHLTFVVARRDDSRYPICRRPKLGAPTPRTLPARS